MLKLQKIVGSSRLLLSRPNAAAAKGFLEEQGRKSLWGYVAIAFNRVDADRLKAVGPNRLCAEWLMKNGGGVRLVEMPSKVLRDYNVLPPESTKFRILEVDASNSSVMKIGLEHFKGCEHIQKVIFHNCKHLEDDGLEGLLHLRESLLELQVSGCSNIPDAGLEIIGELKLLRELNISDMNYVKNLDAVVQKLQKQLPACIINAEHKK